MIRELKFHAESQILDIIDDFMNETRLDVDDVEYEPVLNANGQVVSFRIRLVAEV
jgi:hypothetical protein